MIGGTWNFALVTNIQKDDDEDDDEDDNEDNSSSISFKVKALEDIASKDEMHESLFVVYLMNVTTNRRIWNALHKRENLKIIKEVLHTGSTVRISHYMFEICFYECGIILDNLVLLFVTNGCVYDASGYVH